jgi:hypothetical protein
MFCYSINSIKIPDNIDRILNLKEGALQGYVRCNLLASAPMLNPCTKIENTTIM